MTGRTTTNPTTMHFDKTPAGHAITRHYRFSYPAFQSDQVERITSKADDTFDQVAALLRVDGGAPIDVDLNGSAKNTMGTAGNQSIRMMLNQPDPLMTLAHESTHVIAARLAGGTDADAFERMIVLNEGLATWVQRRLSGDGGFTELDRLECAVVAQRNLIKPELLTRPDELARLQDLSLQYPLGAALVDALVRRYGPTAPRDLLLTLGKKALPPKPSGLRAVAGGLSADRVFDLSLSCSTTIRISSRPGRKRTRCRFSGAAPARGVVVKDA